MEGFFVDIIENTTSNKIIQLEIMHKSFANMLLCPPYSGSTYKVNVNPGCCESIVKKQVSLLETTDYSMGRRMRVIDA